MNGIQGTANELLPDSQVKLPGNELPSLASFPPSFLPAYFPLPPQSPPAHPRSLSPSSSSLRHLPCLASRAIFRLVWPPAPSHHGHPTNPLRVRPFRQTEDQTCSSTAAAAADNNNASKSISAPGVFRLLTAAAAGCGRGAGNFIIRQSSV